MTASTNQGTPMLSQSQHRLLATSRWLAHTMDTRWHIGPMRFGLDAAFDLVPGLGTLGSLAISLYQFGLATKLALPPSRLARMALNVAIDGVAGTVPVIGDLVDVSFRVHARNQQIIDSHLAMRDRMIASDSGAY